MTITIFDAVLLCIVMIVTVRGAIKGFVSEFFSKAAVILGALAAVLFYARLSPYVSDLLGPDIYPQAVSFLVIFLAVYLVVKLFQHLAGTAVQGETMTSLDRALGVFLGIAEGFVMVTVILMFLHAQKWFDAGTLLDGSLIDRLLMPLTRQGPSALSGFMETMER
jgi:membrane protein required for colicin V production